MAFSAEQKERLALVEVSDDATVRARLERWMSATGWTEDDVADSIGYSRSAVMLFRIGRYCENHRRAENSRALRVALCELMDARPAELTRRARGTPYRTRTYWKVRRAFFKALGNPSWAYVIDGPPGSQKSYVLETLCDELREQEAGKNGSGRRVLYVRCLPAMSRRDLLTEIAMAAGVLARRGTTGQRLRKIRHHFAGRRVLLVLDEAQELTVDALNTVRALLDEPPYMGLIFAGSHEVQQKMCRLEMEQWRSRLQNVLELDGLQEEEIAEIVNRELGPQSKAQIAQFVANSRVRDYRRRDCWYLSARSLFFTLDQIKARTAEKAAAN